MATILRMSAADLLDQAAVMDYLGTLVHIYDHYFNELNQDMLVRIRPIDNSDKPCATGWVSYKTLKVI